MADKSDYRDNYLEKEDVYPVLKQLALHDEKGLGPTQIQKNLGYGAVPNYSRMLSALAEIGITRRKNSKHLINYTQFIQTFEEIWGFKTPEQMHHLIEHYVEHYLKDQRNSTVKDMLGQDLLSGLKVYTGLIQVDNPDWLEEVMQKMTEKIDVESAPTGYIALFFEEDR